MENTSPWKWHLDQEFKDGKVSATISSSDGQSTFKISGIPGKMVDALTALLISSYKWGYQDGTPAPVAEPAQKELDLKDKK